MSYDLAVFEKILSKATAEQLFLDFFQGAETVNSIEWVEMDM